MTGVRPEILALTSIVYFVREGRRGRIKIGHTTDIEQRITTLQTSVSEPLRLLAAMPGDRFLERRLHDRFASYRYRGEWFEPSAAIFEFLHEWLREEEATPPAPKPMPKPVGVPIADLPAAEREAVIGKLRDLPFRKRGGAR